MKTEMGAPVKRSQRPCSGKVLEIIEDGSMAAMGVTSGLSFRNRLYNPKYGFE